MGHPRESELDRKRGQWIEENIPKEGGTAVETQFAGPTKNSRTVVTLKEAGIGHHESQRALIAASLANMTHGGDRRSDQAANLPVGKISQPEAAKMLNVSERLIRQVKGPSWPCNSSRCWQRRRGEGKHMA
jgi:hypothetical protein